MVSNLDIFFLLEGNSQDLVMLVFFALINNYKYDISAEVFFFHDVCHISNTITALGKGSF